MGLHVVRRSQWKDGSSGGGKAVVSCEDTTDSVASESKYEVRSL